MVIVEEIYKVTLFMRKSSETSRMLKTSESDDLKYQSLNQKNKKVIKEYYLAKNNHMEAMRHVAAREGSSISFFFET